MEKRGLQRKCLMGAVSNDDHCTRGLLRKVDAGWRGDLPEQWSHDNAVWRADSNIGLRAGEQALNVVAEPGNKDLADVQELERERGLKRGGQAAKNCRRWARS